jgi:hypothetical protein
MRRQPKGKALRWQLTALRHLEHISEVCPSPTLKAYREAIQAAKKELEEQLRARRRRAGKPLAEEE